MDAAVATKHLGNCGYRVFRHAHVFGAKIAINSFLFDVALIDANVPRRENDKACEGVGLFVAAHVQATLPECRIIVWSSDERAAAKAAALGVAFVLKKDIGALLQAIRGTQ